MAIAITTPRILQLTPGVAGVDEAGRGPLAGPVVAAAVILPEGFDPCGLDDSKRLAPDKREAQADRIQREAVYAVAIVDHDVIDEINILQATLLAMRQAVESLPAPPKSLVIDGNQVPRGLALAANAIPKADATYACVAAASILAKTMRDRIMVDMARQFEGYGFERHFGYPTPEHFEALRRIGPCRIHRRSFLPVREAEQWKLLDA